MLLQLRLRRPSHKSPDMDMETLALVATVAVPETAVAAETAVAETEARSNA